MGLSDEHARAWPNGWALVWAQRSRMQTLAIGAVVFWLAYDHGGFDLEARNPFAISVWWAVLLGVGVAVWPLARVPREAFAAAGFLAALAAWTLVSAAWAPSGETALSEFDLAGLYLGVLVLTIVASRRANVERWVDGLALGIAAVALLAVASRLRPGLFPRSDEVVAAIPSARSRLSYPIGYWNGLAALAALGVPMLFHVAAAAGRSAIVRSLALAGVPLLAATIYLTSSRGGAVAAALAAGVLLGLTDRRWAALGTMAIAGIGSALAVLVFADRSYLTNGGTGSLALDQGRSAAFLLAAVCVATGAFFLAALTYWPARRDPPVWAGRAIAAAAALAVIGVLAAGHPLRWFDHFRAAPVASPSSSVDATSHLLNSAGSGRWQFWTAAGSEFVHHPLIGGGAGSFGRWWDRHGSFAYTTQDAHSLYLETVGELGIVGVLLLLGALGAGLTAIVRRVARGRGRHPVTPALVAAFAAYVFSAGIDWVWELPAVTAVAFVVLGLLVGPATEKAADDLRPASSPSREAWLLRRYGLATRVTALVLGWLVVCAQALPLFAQLKIGESQAAVRSADTKSALAAARAARALEPWAASPYLQLALVEEQAGRIGNALDFIQAAIRRDATDWRLWLVAARLQVKAGRSDKARASLLRVRELNPRSPLLAPLYRLLSS